MTFAERLKEARNFLGISQQEIAKQLGISKPAWQGYELGKNEPGSFVIEKMVDLGFDANWLLTGKGSMTNMLKYDEDLLHAVIEAAESYWLKEGKNLSPAEKADMITSVYEMALGTDRQNDEVEIEDIIKGSEIFDGMMSKAVDQMINLDPAKRERFRKGFEIHLKKIFKGAFGSKDDLEFFIDELIGSHMIRRHMKDGTLKFPVKNKDGTIRLVNFKELNAPKESKNRKP